MTEIRPEGKSMDELQAALKQRHLSQAKEMGILPEEATTEDLTLDVRQEMINHGFSFVDRRLRSSSPRIRYDPEPDDLY